jgi:CHAT domain-containing protein
MSPSVHPSALVKMATFYAHHLGQLGEAELLLKRALSYEQEDPQPGATWSAQAHFELGEIYGKQLRRVESTHHYAQACEAFKALDDAGRASEIQCLERLIAKHVRNYQFAKTAPLLERLIVIKGERLDASDQEMVDLRDQLKMAYVISQDLASLEQLARDYKALHGPTHSITTRLLYSISTLYRRQGSNETADRIEAEIPHAHRDRYEAEQTAHLRGAVPEPPEENMLGFPGMSGGMNMSFADISSLMTTTPSRQQAYHNAYYTMGLNFQGGLFYPDEVSNNEQLIRAVLDSVLSHKGRSLDIYAARQANYLGLNDPTTASLVDSLDALARRISRSVLTGPQHISSADDSLQLAILHERYEQVEMELYALAARHGLKATYKARMQSHMAEAQRNNKARIAGYLDMVRQHMSEDEMQAVEAQVNSAMAEAESFLTDSLSTVLDTALVPWLDALDNLHSKPVSDERFEGMSPSEIILLMGSVLEDSRVASKTVAAALPEGSVLIEYATLLTSDDAQSFPSEQYVALVLYPDGRIQFAFLGRKSRTDSLITAYRQAIADSDPTRTGDIQRQQAEVRLRSLAQRLDATLVEPLNLQANLRLFVSAEGLLHLLPFEALIDQGGTYLADRHVLSYVNSGRDLVQFRAPPAPSSTGSMYVFADPNFDQEAKLTQQVNRAGRLTRSLSLRSTDLNTVRFERLAGAKAEAEMLTQLLDLDPDHVLTGERASEEALFTLDAPWRLHVATHGFFLDDKSPSWPSAKRSLTASFLARYETPLMRSGLALAGANTYRTTPENAPANYDGIATAYEIAGLDFTGTDLVVLSACQTGVGESRNGEGVYGLKRAFQRAGAKTVIMSLWAVDDQVTLELMSAFYRELEAGSSKSEALRTAARSIRNQAEYAHPFYWAAFVLAGDPGL